MSRKRYTEEFKIAAVKQVADRGHPASEVTARLEGEHPQLIRVDKALRHAGGERKAVDS
jgi:transposase